MTYSFSITRVDEETDRTHAAELAFLANTGNWATFYSKIYQYTALPDDQGVVADSNVREWFRVCGAQPIFAEIDMTACHRDPC